MKIFGVIHLKGLPGSTSNNLPLDEIIHLAQNDIEALTKLLHEGFRLIAYSVDIRIIDVGLRRGVNCFKEIFR